MNPDDFWKIIQDEGSNYLRNLSVPLTITLIASYILLRSVKNYEAAKLRSTHKDQIINEILTISHTYNNFSICSTYDQNITLNLLKHYQKK